MIDPMGKIIAELRADVGVSTIVGTKVWGAETPDKVAGQPLPKDPRPYVRLTRLVGVRAKRAPVQSLRISATCVAKTPRLASQLSGAVSDALHAKGPRQVPGGTAIYLSMEEVGGQPTTDQFTGWPAEVAIFMVHAATSAVA